MWSITATITDVLWQAALAVIPLAIVVAVICRWAPCRPATRHTLWLCVLIWLVAGPLLPPIVVSPVAPETISPTAEPVVIFNHRNQKRSAERDDVVEPISQPSPTPPGTVGRSDSVASSPHLAAELDGRLSALTTPALDAPAYDDALCPPASAFTTWDLARADGERLLLQPIPECELPEAIDHRPWIQPERVEPTFALASPDADVPAEAATVDSTHRRAERSAGVEAKKSTAPETLVTGWIRGLASLRDALGALPSFPAPIWLTGLLLLLAFRTRRVLRFHQLMASGAEATEQVRQLVTETACDLGLAHPPRTLLIPHRISPMVWCGRKAILLLPADLWRELDETGRRAVVAHELAHIRRRDHWVCWFEYVIGAVYWWHPMVWWVRGRLRDEADHCCDAWVTWLDPQGRRAYAEALLRTRQFISESNVAVPARGMAVISGRARRFARRLTMVMTQRVQPGCSVWGIALAVVTIAAGWVATPARSCPPETAPSAVVAPAEPAPPRTLIRKVEPMPTAPSAPALILAQHPRADRDKKLEDRIMRLEKRLDELMSHLDRMQARSAEAAEAQAGLFAAKKRDKEQAQHAFAEARRAQESARAALMHPRAISRATNAGIVVRQYKVPAGRRQALAELMLRSDVPTRVRATEQGIEVHASEADQAKFKAFVEIIRTGETYIVKYDLPEGKLDALTELMVRDDVPVLISHPEGGKIPVHGTAAVHAVFKAFLDMIHPQDSRSSQTGRFFDREAAYKDAVTATARQRVASTVKRYYADHQDKRAVIAKLLRTVEQLEAEAEELEEKADDLSDKAEALRDKAESMRGKAKRTRGDEAAKLEDRLHGILAKANDFEALAASLRHKAADIEAEADHLAEKAEDEHEDLEGHDDDDEEHDHDHDDDHDHDHDDDHDHDHDHDG